jgi:hypothetical protein
VEVYPADDPECLVPLHLKLLHDHGVLLCELLDLERLASRLATDGRATFLFVAAPLPLVGGVGTPVAPIAVL